jgi:hypothetical protein
MKKKPNKKKTELIYLIEMSKEDMMNVMRGAGLQYKIKNMLINIRRRQ